MEIRYVGRPERASPAEGYPAAHAAEQSRIIREALGIETAKAPLKTMTAEGEGQG
jgi:2-oxoglutarate dehydrogenase E1 component